MQTKNYLYANLYQSMKIYLKYLNLISRRMRAFCVQTYNIQSNFLSLPNPLADKESLFGSKVYRFYIVTPVFSCGQVTSLNQNLGVAS